MALFQSADEPVAIDLVGFAETTLILLSAVIEPLRAANRITGRRIYSWRLLSPDGQPIETTAGISVPVDGTFRADGETRPLFVLASYNWQRHNTSLIRTALSRVARHREVIVGVESGTWLLAEASLLDNHRATVHFEDHGTFADRFPAIDVATDRYVIDGKRVTSGGALATLDLMLEIIRRRQGYSVALEVSRSFLYEREKTVRDTLPVSATPFGQLDERLNAAIRLMEASLDQPLGVDDIAARVGVSARYLQHLFQKALKVAPHVHYLGLRLNAARRRVIETPEDLAEIALSTGFNAPSAFSRAYRARFGESPSDTRKRAAAVRRPR